MKNNPETTPLTLLALCLGVIALLQVFYCCSHSNDNNNKNKVSSDTATIKKVENKHIPGIKPPDIYLGFEKQGFTTKKEFIEGSAFWINDLEENGIRYNVRTYSDRGVDNVDNVRLSAMRLEPQYNTVESMKPFLKFGCSFQFTDYNIDKINAFIDENYDNNKSSIIISGVKFTIYAPTEFIRMVDIEKASE